jgi:hypothetical protein
MRELLGHFSKNCYEAIAMHASKRGMLETIKRGRCKNDTNGFRADFNPLRKFFVA